MDGVVVEPLSRTCRQPNPPPHFHLDIFLLHNSLVLLLRLFLPRGILHGCWFFEWWWVVADESDLFDESIGEFALGAFGRRLGFLGLGLLRVLFLEGVEGKSGGCFGEVDDKGRVLLRIHISYYAAKGNTPLIK